MNKISVGYTKLFYSNSGFAIMFISSPHSLMISWDLGCFAPIHYYPNKLPLTWTFYHRGSRLHNIIYIQSAEASINSYPVLCIVYFFYLSISIIIFIYPKNVSEGFSSIPRLHRLQLLSHLHQLLRHAAQLCRGSWSLKRFRKRFEMPWNKKTLSRNKRGIHGGYCAQTLSNYSKTM